MASSEDLAADLGVGEGDVRVLLRQLGEQTPDLPDELGGGGRCGSWCAGRR
jgi:hypothetical protein